MKKTIVLLVLLTAFSSALFSSRLSLKAKGLPSSVELSWNEINGALWYDVYSDGEPVERISPERLSYTVKNLPPENSFTFQVVARGAGDSVLANEKTEAETTSWSGTYRWVNKTDNDRDGKLKSLTLRLELENDDEAGVYYDIYYVRDDGSEVLFHPLFPFGSEESKKWTKYKDNSSAAISYRINAELVNESSLTPGQWRIESVENLYDSTTTYIQTKTAGITVTTKTETKAFIEDGKRKLSYLTSSESKLLKNKLFKNPNPGEGDALILVEI